MDDIFKFATQSGSDAVKNRVGLLDLVNELHAIYGVYVYSQTEPGRVSLIYPNGLFFGEAGSHNNQEGRTVYSLKHKKIKKERATLNSRNTRASTSLKTMMKLLRKEIPTIRPAINELMGNLSKVYGRVMSAAHSAMKADQSPSMYLKDSEVKDLVLHHMDGNALPQEIHDKMVKYRKELHKMEERVASYKERLTCFETAYLLYTSNSTPTIFAEMRKDKHTINGKIEDVYVPVGDWRIVKELDDLPVEALSALKMWELANEKRILENRPWGIEVDTPVNRFLINSDDFYAESDVVSRYDSFDGYRDYFVAVAKGPSNERSN
jgi:hypothetical protein